MNHDKSDLEVYRCFTCGNRLW